jgi:hypothetical protein
MSDTILFCGEGGPPIDEPPTSGDNPLGSDGLYHYEGCCGVWDKYIKEKRLQKREETIFSIMSYIYVFITNGGTCPHDDAFFITKENEYKLCLEKNALTGAPPPLIGFHKLQWPLCCIRYNNVVKPAAPFTKEEVLANPVVKTKYESILNIEQFITSEPQWWSLF